MGRLSTDLTLFRGKRSEEALRRKMRMEKIRASEHLKRRPIHVPCVSPLQAHPQRMVLPVDCTGAYIKSRMGLE